MSLDMNLIEEEKENIIVRRHINGSCRRTEGLKTIGVFDGLSHPNDFSSPLQDYYNEGNDTVSVDRQSNCFSKHHVNTLCDNGEHWRDESNDTNISNDIYTDCYNFGGKGNQCISNCYQLSNPSIQINSQPWEDTFKFVAIKQKWSEHRQTEYRTIFKQIALSESQLLSLYGGKRLHGQFHLKKSLKSIYLYWFTKS